MLANLNVRVLGNDAIFVSYNEDGKAKDAAFPCWADFIAWLSGAVGEQMWGNDGRR